MPQPPTPTGATKELTKQPILDLQTHRAILVDHLWSCNKSIIPHRHMSPTPILGNFAASNNGKELRLLQQFNPTQAPKISHASRRQEHAKSNPVLGGLNHMILFPLNLCGKIANTIAVPGGLINARGTEFPSLIIHLYAPAKNQLAPNGT